MGLSLGYDIVVKQHGGQLRVDSQEDNFVAHVLCQKDLELGIRAGERKVLFITACYAMRSLGHRYRVAWQNSAPVDECSLSKSTELRTGLGRPAVATRR